MADLDKRTHKRVTTKKNPISVKKDGSVVTKKSPVLNVELEDEITGKYAYGDGNSKKTLNLKKYVIVGVILIPLVLFALDTPLRKAIPSFMRTAVVIVLAVVALGILMGDKIIRRKEHTELETESETSKYLPKLLDIRDKISARGRLVKDEELKDCTFQIVSSLNSIISQIKKNKNEERKIRKFANYYGDLITKLLDKYLMFQEAIEKNENIGENVATSMEKIKKGLVGASNSLKESLNSLYLDDAMDVSADVKVLEQLMSNKGIELKELDK